MQDAGNIGQLTALTSPTLTHFGELKLSSSVSRLQSLRHLDLRCNTYPEVSTCSLACMKVDSLLSQCCIFPLIAPTQCLWKQCIPPRSACILISFIASLAHL